MASPEHEKKAARIQWEDADIEQAARPAPSLRRTTSQFSINSVHSRRSIDPANAFPIIYRTV